MTPATDPEQGRGEQYPAVSNCCLIENRQKAQRQNWDDLRLDRAHPSSVATHQHADRPPSRGTGWLGRRDLGYTAASVLPIPLPPIRLVPPCSRMDLQELLQVSWVALQAQHNARPSRSAGRSGRVYDVLQQLLPAAAVTATAAAPWPATIVLFRRAAMRAASHLRLRGIAAAAAAVAGLRLRSACTAVLAPRCGGRRRGAQPVEACEVAAQQRGVEPGQYGQGRQLQGGEADGAGADVLAARPDLLRRCSEEGAGEDARTELCGLEVAAQSMCLRLVPGLHVQIPGGHRVVRAV